MKKSTLFVLSSLCAASLFAGTPMEVVGGDGAESGRTSIPSGDYDVILKPNADTPSKAFFKTNSEGGLVTINSLTTEGNPDLWDIAYSLTIDVKNSSSDVIENVLVNNGKMQWRIGGVTFKNSLGNSATAKINLGEEFRLVHNNGGQSTWLAFSMNANVEGKYLNALDYEKTGLKADNGSTVNWNVTRSSFAKLNSGVYVSGNSTFNNTGAMEFNSGTVLDIETGSVFNTTTAPTFKEGSTVNVRGEYNYTAAAGQSLTLRDASITGTLITKGGVGSNLTLAGKTTVSGNGIINANGAIIIDSGSLTVSDNGKISIVDDETYEPRIRMGGGTLTLNVENAVQVNSTRFNLANIVVYGGNGSKLIVNEDNKFRSLYFQSNHNITLDVAEDATVFFEQISIGTGGGGTLLIENFGDERIFFASSDHWETISISATDKNGKTFTKDDLELVAGTYIDGTNGFWLNAVVPEPSTYAMIFGAIALGFAAYRRRK